MKKIGIFFLAAVLCLSVMTSCVIEIDDRTEGGETDVETTPETEYRAEVITPMKDPLSDGKRAAESALLAIFPDTDLEGRDLTLVIVEESDLTFGASEDASHGKALTEAAELISKRLKCNLTVKTVPYDTFLIDSKVMADAGQVYADLVCIPQKAVGYMRNQNMLADLTALYGDVFGEDCYDLDSTLQLGGNGKLYGVVGDGAVCPGAYTCIYMNKTLTDQYGITEEIYQTVRDGGWTVDAMLGFKAKCAELPADVITVGAPDRDAFVKALFGASGMNYFAATKEALPALAPNGARLDGLVAKLKAVFADPLAFVAGDDVYRSFEQGKVMFYVDTLEAAEGLKGSYTLLPMPKADGEQAEYFTPANENAFVFGVLTSNPQPQHALLLLRAFNECGQLIADGWARDFLDIALRNGESYTFLKDMMQNPVYDLAYMYGESYASVAESTYKALLQAVDTNSPYSYYTGRQTWALKNDLTKMYS